MTVIIAKNQTVADLPLVQTPIPNNMILASPATVTLTNYASLNELREDQQLLGYVTSGDVVLNDGSVDLTIAQAQILLTELTSTTTTSLDVAATATADHLPLADGNGFIHPSWVATAQRVRVGLSGSVEFTSIKAAIASITDATITKPYVIDVGPGIYTEDPFTMKSYVAVVGQGILSTVLETTDPNNHFITGAPGAYLKGVGVLGPSGTGLATLYYASESNVPFFIVDVVLHGGYYGVWVNPAAARGIVHAINVGNHYVGSPMNTFMRSTGYGNITAMSSGFMSGPSSSVVHGFYCSGANAEMTLDVCFHRNAGSTNGLFVDDGSFVRANGCTFSSGVNAIHLGPTGSGTQVTAASCTIKNGGFSSLDLWTESSSAILTFMGVADLHQVDVMADTLLGLIVHEDNVLSGTIVSGELWLGASLGSTTIPVRALLQSTAPTGYVSGGVVTRGTGLEVDVTSGVGFVNTGAGVNHVVWGAASALTIGADVDFWVYVNSAGVVSVALSTEPSEEANILLATGRSNSSSIVNLTTYHIAVDQSFERLHEFITDTMGVVWITGGAVTKSTEPGLGFNVTASSFYVGLDSLTTAGATPITFIYWYRDGSGGWSHTSSQTDINTAYYDASTGTLTSIPSGEWKKDVLYVTVGGDGTEYHMVYAQETFASQVLAEAGGLPVPPELLARHALRLFGAVVQQGATNLTTLVDHRPTFGTQGTGSTASTIHSALSGLNVDDHTQYLLLAGGSSRNALTGTLDASGGTLVLPTATDPAQTQEGSVEWDSNDDHLTVGTGTARKILMNQGDSAGGDVGGTFPTALTVTDLTISGESQGDLLYFNGTNWVRLSPGTDGQQLQTNGAGANPSWENPFVPQYAQSTTLASTSSTGWLTYVTLNTTTLPAGTYRVGGCLIWRTSHDAKARVTVDGAIGWEMQQEGEDTGTDQRIPGSGFYYVTFATTTTHTVLLQYTSSSNSSTMSVYQGAIDIVRVS